MINKEGLFTVDFMLRDECPEDGGKNQASVRMPTTLLLPLITLSVFMVLK